ncbi:MAG TPA: PAS domain S-box protein [Pseudolabrys sp.]|jgi:PAS domain S-box-containing protein
MSGTEFRFTCLSDQRLAAHALSPTPVWLWSADATRVLWANPVAAAIFDAASPGALADIRFGPQHAAAAQVARLAGTLPQGGVSRLERLRGFGAAYGGTLICLCSRIVLSDNIPAVLVVSTERAGKDLALPDRARRLLADLERPAAVFTADGELIESVPAARERFGDKRDLIALGAEQLAREASLNGRADGDIAAWPATVLRLGAGATVTLLVAFAAPRQTAGSNTAAAFAQAARPAPSLTAAETHPRRFPLRFVWQMDVANRFTLGTQDFAKLLGPKTAAVLGRPWAEIAATLKLDPQDQVANALAARGTWSGIIVPWPVDGEEQPLPIEMSGLPVFDRDRQFAGYRGFGICRDVDRLTALDQLRAQAAGAPTVIIAEPPPDNVLPFPSPAEEPPALSPGERSAFEELARELSARLKGTTGKGTAPGPDDFAPAPIAAVPRPARNGDTARDIQEGRPIFDRLPVGILVYRLNTLLYANRAFLDWTGYPSLEALTEAGGLDSLFIDTKSEPAAGETKNNGKTLTITTVNGKQKPVEGRLFSAAWKNENALVLMISTQAVSADRDTAMSLRRLESENGELKSILDTATDGVLVLDRAGRILSASRSAEALFGYEASEIAELNFGDLFAPESRRPVLDYLDRLANGAGVLDTGREAIGLVRQGGLVPLYFTLGRISDGEKFCAVMRDITAWKRTEEELINAKQQAEKASTAKSEFLAKISHEIRTPLNAIIGFSEVMMNERFGPVGNERYQQYLTDIHTSGGHLISLLNDLLDLSKIEAGKLELTFVSVNLNDLVQQCVAIMQQQANRERVIIRTSLPPNLPQIVADARSVRQIALNLLSNSIKFTGAGGQVIVATASNDEHEIVLRVRDTGPGMSEKELQTALEPFRQIAITSRAGGSGLGLPISKALAEANHARFRITSQVDEGTLVEVAFPATRVLAQ